MSDSTIRPMDVVKPILRPTFKNKPTEAPSVDTPKIIQDALAFSQQATQGPALSNPVAAAKGQVPVFDNINAGLPGGGGDPTKTQNLTAPLFKGGASASQVEQGWIGDCEIVAAVTAIAARNPNFFKNRISENADGTVTVKTSKWTQTVDRQVYWDTKHNLPMNGDDRGSGTSWFPLLEKAMAFQVKGYNKLDSQNDIAYAFDLFAGGMRTFNLSDRNFDTLLTNFNSGRAVTAMHDNAGTAIGLFPEHGYAVIGMTKDTVTLQNPYGPRALASGTPADPEPDKVDHMGSATDGVFSMSRADFVKYFAAASYSANAVV